MGKGVRGGSAAARGPVVGALAALAVAGGGLDRRREVDADRVADALQGRQLQRHAHDAVHHLVDRRPRGGVAAVAGARRAAEAADLVDADAVDLLGRLHHLRDDLRHLVEAVAFELQLHQAVAARVLGLDQRAAAFRLGEHAKALGFGPGAHRLRFGLLGIKGLGEAPARAIVEARAHLGGKFKSLAEFAESLDTKTLNRRLLDALAFAGATDSLGFTRAAIVQSADEILKFSAAAQLDKSSGQTSLFGGADEEAARLQIQNAKEFSDEEKLLKEKQVLGLYLTSHPLDRFTDVAAHMRLTQIADLDDGVSKERRVSVLAVIDSLRTVTSKRGAFYLLKITDRTGQIEVRIFQNMFEQVKPFIRENSCAIFDIRVQAFREEEVTTMNYSLAGIVPEEKFTERVEKSLHLYLNVKTPSDLEAMIGRVKTTLRKYSGNNPVYLYWREIEGGPLQSIKAHSSFCVKYDKALLKDVSQLLGAEKYALFKVGGIMEAAQGATVN